MESASTTVMNVVAEKRDRVDRKNHEEVLKVSADSFSPSAAPGSLRPITYHRAYDTDVPVGAFSPSGNVTVPVRWSAPHPWRQPLNAFQRARQATKYINWR